MAKSIKRKITETITFDGRIMGFLQASRGRSQEEIIIEFVRAVIEVNPVADEGSVLINHPKIEKLVLFNENDFLFKRKMLDARASWPKTFEYSHGIAGRCFREASVQIYPSERPKADKDFVGNSPIKNMVCIPIITKKGGVPFGVACFHNNDKARAFSSADERVLRAYTDILALALHTPHPELQLEPNVFIVHGRDNSSLRGLKKILKAYGVAPKVLLDEDKNVKSILGALEELIRTCKAGFVLATPDDVGRLATDKDLAPRARESVVFEMGLLLAKFREFERVAILVKRPLKLPSDLDGITTELFDDIREPKLARAIKRKLTSWQIIRTGGYRRSGSRSAGRPARRLGSG
jgi:predicted nucleotide-binding protein